MYYYLATKYRLTEPFDDYGDHLMLPNGYGNDFRITINGYTKLCFVKSNEKITFKEFKNNYEKYDTKIFKIYNEYQTKIDDEFEISFNLSKYTENSFTVGFPFLRRLSV